MQQISINRARIFKRDNWTCLYCGASGIQNQVVLHADHLMPFSSGGSNEASNICTACGPCNLQKKDSYLDPSDMTTLKGIIWNRNITNRIPQDACVQGVRTKKNGVSPQKTYSVRLSDTEAEYCEESGGTVSSFIKSLIQAHKAAKDAEKEKEAQKANRVFVVKQLVKDNKETDRLLEEATQDEELFASVETQTRNESTAKHYAARIKEEERLAEKKLKKQQEERRKEIMAELREDRRNGEGAQPVYKERKKPIMDMRTGPSFDEEVERATIRSFDPDEYVPE